MAGETVQPRRPTTRVLIPVAIVVWLVVAITLFVGVAANTGMGDMMNGMGGMHGMMGRGSVPQSTGSASGQASVQIQDFAFQPTVLTVTPGTIVTWTNRDSAPHTATGDAFDTGRLDQGESGTATFNTLGQYDYICTYHPSMQGTVVVRAAGG